ncbi:MAG: enoyl-CoA hydratase [Acidimicrobiaceae bacterium]|nr:enoyl-CoA hydratase [Acidimicrobiaceae bacterium]
MTIDTYRTLSADEAVDLLTSPTVDLEVGILRGVPILVVEDADRLPVVTTNALTGLPVVSVGIAPPGRAPGFDVLVDDVDAAGEVVKGVTANPMAAVTCCQLLRQAPNLSTEAGLLTESTAYGTLQSGPEFARWMATRDLRARTAEDRPPVRVETCPNEVVLTLDRPRQRNAWSAAMRNALVESIRPLATDGDDRPIRLKGSGSAFCSGGDLAEFGTVDNPATGHLIRSSINAAPWLDRLADRLTVVVQGPTVGAGVELAAFARRVEAVDGATFRLPEVSMGLVPGAGGTLSVPRRIGRQRTAWLCLTGKPIDVLTALSWGLADELVG